MYLGGRYLCMSGRFLAQRLVPLESELFTYLGKIAKKNNDLNLAFEVNTCMRLLQIALF